MGVWHNKHRMNNAVFYEWKLTKVVQIVKLLYDRNFIINQIDITEAQPKAEMHNLLIQRANLYISDWFAGRRK